LQFQNELLDDMLYRGTAVCFMPWVDLAPVQILHLVNVMVTVGGSLKEEAQVFSKNRNTIVLNWMWTSMPSRGRMILKCRQHTAEAFHAAPAACTPNTLFAYLSSHHSSLVVGIGHTSC